MKSAFGKMFCEDAKNVGVPGLYAPAPGFPGLYTPVLVLYTPEDPGLYIAGLVVYTLDVVYPLSRFFMKHGRPE